MAGARTRGPAPSETAAAKHRLEAVPDAAMGIRQLHQVLEASSESIVCIDRSWHCTFVNQAARAILKSDDLIGANLWTRFPLNQQEPFASNYRATMEQRVPTDFDAYYPEPLDVWFKVAARPYDGGMIIFSTDITERKRGEKERRLIAQEVQAFFDASPNAVVGMNRDWTITFCNKTARERSTPEEILGTSLWTRFPLSVEEPYFSHYHRTMQERIHSEFEIFVPAPDNLWLKVVARPFGDGIMVLHSDITKSKQAEALRDASARKLEQVLEATTDGIVSLDRNWTYTLVNRRAEMLLRRNDLMGKNLWEEFPSTSADGPLRSAMDDRVACEFEAFNPAPLNSWFRIQTRPSEDGIVIFFRDITEERAAQQTLLARQATLAFVQQTARVATWEIDLATRQLTMSEGSFPVWGRSLTEVTTLDDFYAILHPEDRHVLTQRHRTAAAGKDLQAVDYRVIAPNGEILWLEGRSITVVDEHGVPTHLRGMTMDITARKNAEALRDTASRQLEQVLEATTDAVVSVDRNWTMTFVNPQGRRMLGRDDLVGKNAWKEFPAAVDSQIFQRYHETMATGRPCDFEEYYPEPLNLWLSIQCRASAEGIVVFSHSTTEEHRARQKLLNQQATLAFVQETALVATWVIDLATGAMAIAEGSSPVFGVPNEQIKTTADFRRAVHPEDLPLVTKRTQEVIVTGGVAAVDYRVLTPDGSTRWLEGRAIVEHNEHGVAKRLRGMTTDITARKQDEQKLRASEQRYRVLADLNPQTLWIGEPDGKISYTNQGYVEYRGVETEEVLGTRWNEGFHPEDREPAMKVWMHSVATGEDYSTEARIPSSEGEFRWWALRALPVRDEAGNILNWMGVAHDIHDMKVATETLQRKQEETERQRAELETVYRTAPIGLALYDPVDFRYLRVNDHLCETLHKPAEQILGRQAGSFGSVPGVLELFREVANGRVLRDHIVEGIYANDEHRYFNLNCSPVYAPDGTIQAIAVASLEITHQKKSELALIQSEKLAAVGRLASSISHEINNPLEAITNLLYLVATDEHLHEEVKVYVHMAQSELARVSQITTQTLRFHRQAVKPTLVTAAELVDSVLGLYQGRLGNSNIRVEATYASKIPIFCFENDLRQVLNNLIANAIDAMRNGGRLLVRAHEGTDWLPSGDGAAARKGIRITVADTGHGMPAAVMARVFEPFYTTKDLNGTGLGLWISAGIVQHHKGRLTVRSSQASGHTGTAFTLFLPLENLTA